MGIRIVFMGTPDFAVASLDAIVKSGIKVAGIITAPDKPAGRGKKILSSAVKKYASDNNIKTILQPTNLKNSDFIAELKNLNADLFVVVAFRMLPEIVWAMPRFGTINLHGSLLPDYRGAAPINWAVINGEKVTGATTFFIQHEIDSGNIIDQCKIDIEEKDSAGTTHDKLMLAGAKLLVNTIHKIEAGKAVGKPQSELISGLAVKMAPKIFKEDCKINWNRPVKEVYNFIRGLSPYPTAWTRFKSKTGEELVVKLFETEFQECNHSFEIGSIDFSEKGILKIVCPNGFIIINSLQLAGKKRMDAKAFLLGFNNKEDYALVF